MSILCCCHHRQPAGKDTQTEAIELPRQPPRATLSKTLSRSETDMYLSSILASRAPSQLIIPTYQTIVDPDAVDVEDSDDEAQEGNTRQSNMGTLGVLRTKLIRRLSHRADARAGSQASVGTSDGELARRAELKRLMHKRIQEELKSEEEEDDLRLTSLNQSSVTNNKEPELPGGGPRDGIEFSVCGIDNKETTNEIKASPEASHLPSSVVNEPRCAWQKKSSRGESVQKSIDDSRHNPASLNRTESVSESSSPSYVTPVHNSGEGGRDSFSTASWRQSYSAIQIDSYIEPLVQVSHTPRPPSPEPEEPLSQEDLVAHTQVADTSDAANPSQQDDDIDPSQTIVPKQGDAQEHDTKNCGMPGLSDETSEGRVSPLDVWLWSQGLQRTSRLSTHSNTKTESVRPRFSEAQEQGEYLHQDEIPVNLAADVYSSRAGVSRICRRSLEVTTNEGKPSVTARNSESFTSHPASGQAENVGSSGNCTKNQVQHVSSRCMGKFVSQQATPGGSRRVLQPLTPINGLFNMCHTTASDNSGTSSYRTALNKTPSSDRPKAKLDASLLPMANILSVNASETASYRQREEELKSVKKRFGLTPARRYPSTTAVRSKFREEFDDSKGSSCTRNSILSKLYLAFPKRARVSSSQTESSNNIDGISKQQTDCHDLVTPHTSDMEAHEDNNPLVSNTVLDAHMDKKAAGPCGRVTKSGGGQYNGRFKDKTTKATNSKAVMDATDPQTASVMKQRANSLEIQVKSEERGTSVDHAGSSPTDMAAPNEDEAQTTPDIHTGVLQEWVEQLQAEDVLRQSRTGSKDVGAKQRPRLRTPPASWAKWPSHTRKERNGPAGENDQVTTRDFGTVLNLNPFAAGNGEITPTRNELTASPRTLPAQVGNAIKSGWNKMTMHRSSPGFSSSSAPVAQGIKVCNGHLEYPELELLPTAGCYKEVQALEQQIDNMKRRSMSRQIPSPQPSTHSGKCPLASRIAEEVHKIQPEGNSGDVDYCPRSPLCTQLLTPKHALIIPRSKPCESGPAGTVKAQCTSRDCVQPQILGDDNEESEDIICQDKIMIKRPKSTGNLHVKLPSEGISEEENIESDQVAVHFAPYESGLRRHRSLGFMSRVGHGGRVKPATAGKEKMK